MTKKIKIAFNNPETAEKYELVDPPSGKFVHMIFGEVDLYDLSPKEAEMLVSQKAEFIKKKSKQ